MQVQHQAEKRPPIAPVLPADVDVIREITRPTLSAMKAFNGAFAENCSSYQSEWLQFLGRRWQENAAMPARLAACKSPAELQGEWTGYWTRTFSQYGDEWQKLMQICQVQPAPTADHATLDQTEAAETEPHQRATRPH